MVDIYGFQKSIRLHTYNLYNIMEQFGIPNKLMSLTKMCMKRTKYHVRVEATMSAVFTVETGLKKMCRPISTIENLTLKKH